MNTFSIEPTDLNRFQLEKAVRDMTSLNFKHGARGTVRGSTYTDRAGNEIVYYYGAYEAPEDLGETDYIWSYRDNLTDWLEEAIMVLRWR